MKNYLVCIIENQKLAFELCSIERVFQAVEVTKIPEEKPFVLGVINYHGKVLNVLNLRKRLDLPSRELRAADLFLICHIANEDWVLWIDTIEGIFAFSKQEIEENLEKQTFISGFIKRQDEILLIYDPQQLVYA